MALGEFSALLESVISPGILKAVMSILHLLHATNVNTVILTFIIDYVKSGDICAYSPPSSNAGCCKSFSPKNGKCI